MADEGRVLSDEEIRNLPSGTPLRDPFTGKETALSHHTDFDDGWWLEDGSWLRWHHVQEYLLNAPARGK